jgi:hypothetical protein
VLKNVKDENAVRDPAIIEWVGEINPNNFWLYPCGGWNGERGPNDDWEKASPFELAKARAVIRRPSHELFSDDWKKCIANINRLMSMAKHPQSKIALSILQDSDVKVRHSIFEVRYSFFFFDITHFIQFYRYVAERTLGSRKRFSERRRRR